MWHTYKSPIETTLSVCTIRKYIPKTLIKILENRISYRIADEENENEILFFPRFYFILLKSISH